MNDIMSGFLAQALPGQQTPDGIPSFKLVLVGDGGTGGWARARFWCYLNSLMAHTQLVTVVAAGKTTFVKRHLTGEFEKKYERECRDYQPSC